MTPDLNHSIRLHQAADIEPGELVPLSLLARVAIWVLGGIAAWAAFAAAAYCLYRAALALGLIAS